MRLLVSVNGGLGGHSGTDIARGRANAIKALARTLRETFAEWCTAKKNTQFAQAAVNRMWGHFFGIGIVNPLDISLNNTVAYDRIAEARIAYGGRGRSNDFQQPPWGQQVYDAVRPF